MRGIDHLPFPFAIRACFHDHLSLCLPTKCNQVGIILRFYRFHTEVVSRPLLLDYSMVDSSGPEDCLLILLRQDGADDSGPDVSFEMSASPEYLFGSARARLATSTVSTDATDSGPEPSFDRPAIFGVLFRHRVPISQVSSKDLVWSFDLVRSFDLVQSFDLVRSFDLPVHASVAQGGFCIFSWKYFPFVLVIDFPYFPLDVVDDALAQGADGLRLMKNEDHQVLGSEQKLEEDASDCTRVDDDGVEFSPEGSDYFPTMSDEIKKDKCSIFLLFLIICIQGVGLDKLKHDLSTEESVAQKCKDAIVKNKCEIIRANIKPNKACSEEVADLDLDQLPTSAFIVLVSSIIPILNLSHKNFAHTTGLMTPDLVCPSTYQLLQSSSGDSRPDVSFDMLDSPEYLFGSSRARFDKYLFGQTEQIGTSGPTDGANIEAYLRGPLGLGKRASNIGTPGSTDGANVEAYLRGPLGLGKRASNVRIIWFSFGSFGGGSFESVSFGSSAESKNVVQLRLLWRLLQLLRPLAKSNT
ncbi:hypothetical protein Tco_0086886 [Tanacetum coccineum]